jgi:trimethylamine--corrinoid protein Co-methyltransferase
MGGTESKVVDQQAAAESTLTMLADVFLGDNLIHNLGHLESGLTYSFAQLVISEQMVDCIKGFFREIEVSDLTLALDEHQPESLLQEVQARLMKIIQKAGGKS